MNIIITSMRFTAHIFHQGIFFLETLIIKNEVIIYKNITTKTYSYMRLFSKYLNIGNLLIQYI